MKTLSTSRHAPTWVTAISALTWSLACGSILATEGSTNGATSNTLTDGPTTYLFNARIEKQQDGSQLCNGTRIDDHWVLTAAHCVEQVVWFDEIQIRLGATDLNSAALSGNVWGVSNIYVHPRYHHSSEADIALLKLNPKQINCPDSQCQVSPVGESATISIPTRSEFPRTLAQSSPSTCLQGEKTDGIRLGWGTPSTTTADSTAAQLLFAPMQILNDCVATKAPAIPEDILWTSGTPGNCPSANGGALLAFSKLNARPFLVGIAGMDSDTCDPSQGYSAFSDVTSDDLRQWIVNTVAEGSSQSNDVKSSVQFNSQKLTKSPKIATPVDAEAEPNEPSAVQEPIVPEPTAPQLTSPEQIAVRNAAQFGSTYSTNTQWVIPAGLTTANRPLRIAVAWAGPSEPYDTEYVYNGTAPLTLSHAYDPQGQVNVSVNPRLRVIDSALAGSEPIVKDTSLTLFPVYDISFSPLRSEELHRGGWSEYILGNCDVGSPGEGTLWWEITSPSIPLGGGVSAGYKIRGHQAVNYPGAVIYDPGTTPRYFAEDIPQFATTIHYDTAHNDNYSKPRIDFTEDEIFAVIYPGFKGRAASNLFPFTGDDGTNTKLIVNDLIPEDTDNWACNIRVEYDVTVALDLNPNDNPPPPVVVPPPPVVVPPPPAVTPPPPPSTGGGGPGPSPTEPPIQMQ